MISVEKHAFFNSSPTEPGYKVFPQNAKQSKERNCGKSWLSRNLSGIENLTAACVKFCSFSSYATATGGWQSEKLQC